MKGDLGLDDEFIIDEKERALLHSFRADLSAQKAELAQKKDRIEQAKVSVKEAGIRTEEYFTERKIAAAANNLLYLRQSYMKNR